MVDDLAYHPDNCPCPTHTSIRQAIAERPAPCNCPKCAARSSYRGRVRRIDNTPADIGPPGTPQVGAEFDTSGSGGMYRGGWFVGDRKITHPEKDRLR